MKAPLPVLTLAGSPRERGRAHGEARRDLVRGHFDAWRGSLAAHHPDTRAYLEDLLAGSAFVAAARRLTPDLLGEVEGIAEGAGMAFGDVFALQLLDEEWAFATTSRDKCTTFGAVGGDGRTWFGQNMDLGTYTDGFQLILDIASQNGRPGRRVFTLAGMVGLMGAGEAVGVCVNTLSQLPTDRVGLPVAFVMRGALDEGDLDRAIAFVTSVPHASGQHYLLAGPGRIAGFEGSAAGVSALPAATEAFHTNHPLARPAPPEHPWGANSTTRLNSIEASLRGEAPTTARIEAALSNREGPHPVCRQGGADAFTTGSMYAALGGAKPPLLRFTIGPPAPGAYADMP